MQLEKATKQNKNLALILISQIREFVRQYSLVICKVANLIAILNQFSVNFKSYI